MLDDLTGILLFLHLSLQPGLAGSLLKISSQHPLPEVDDSGRLGHEARYVLIAMPANRLALQASTHAGSDIVRACAHDLRILFLEFGGAARDPLAVE